MKTVFLKALEAEDKGSALLAAIHHPEEALGKRRFELDASSFAAVPRSPFAYWVSERLRQLFIEFPPFESHGRTAKVGLQTSDDFRFVRGWWAVPPTSLRKRWFPFAKGGGASSFYSNIRLCLLWDKEGDEVKAYAETTPGTSHWSRKITATEWYLRPGFSWAVRTARFAPSCVPEGCIFSVSRYQAFTEDSSLLATIGLLNGAICTNLLRMCSERFEHPKFIIGIVQSLPFPSLNISDRDELCKVTRRAWSLTRSCCNYDETSHAFILPALLQAEGSTLTARAEAWARHLHAIEAELTTIHAEIDTRCFDIYRIDEVDRGAIAEEVTVYATRFSELSDSDIDADGEDESDDDDQGGSANIATLAADLVSWAVGVAFGRFDARLATGARPLPEEPEPFDPLPICCPAMLTDHDGVPLKTMPPGYPVAFPADGILVDDRGHVRDLTAAVRVVFEELFSENVDGFWNEVAGLLDPKKHDLRNWLASGFFEHHLRSYTKGRRKAPILWKFSAPSGRYSIWLYAHRMTRDSLFQIQNDIGAPKLAHEERQLASLIESGGASPSAKQRKEIADQKAFVEELHSLLDEVKRAAPLWNPVLDDGVALTMAPLWRLLSQHKPWQKELKSKWEELAAGKYDWAHVAMHVWPERVVPKCATDRSLAIAHGLENVFWVEGEDGKWKPRSAPTRTVDELIGERTSIAVKAALKGFTEASASKGPKTRTRRSPS